MTDREGTPEDFARMAAEARGRRINADRELIDALHPPEPPPEKDEAAEQFVTRLFAPKPGTVEFSRSIHGGDDAA